MTSRDGSGSNDILIGTTFGLVLSSDGGSSWDWVCDDSIGYPMVTNPHPIWLADGTIAIPSYDGLFVSRDGGCTFVQDPAIGRGDVGGVAARGTTVLAAVTVHSSTAALFRSENSGASFEMTGFVRPQTILSSVELAPSAPGTMYAAGWYYEPATAWVFRSTDDGQSFETFEHNLSDPGFLRVASVSPKDPELLLLVSGGALGEVVYRSADGGRTLDPVLTSTLSVRSTMFDADGDAWVATDGYLWRSADGARTFELLASPGRNACVGRVKDDVWACGWPWEDDYAMASWDQGGFHARWQLDDIRGIKACPADTPARRVCEAWWPIIASQLGISLDGPKPTESPDETSCSCRSHRLGGSGLLWLALLALGLRRRH